jgi:hypothetical protein
MNDFDARQHLVLNIFRFKRVFISVIFAINLAMCVLRIYFVETFFVNISFAEKIAF